MHCLPKVLLLCLVVLPAEVVAIEERDGLRAILREILSAKEDAYSEKLSIGEFRRNLRQGGQRKREDVPPYDAGERQLYSKGTFHPSASLSPKPSNSPTSIPENTEMPTIVVFPSYNPSESEPSNSPTEAPTTESITPSEGPIEATVTPSESPSEISSIPTVDISQSPSLATASPSDSSQAPIDLSSTPTAFPTGGSSSPSTAPVVESTSPSTAPSEALDSPSATPSEATVSPSAVPSELSASPSTTATDASFNPSSGIDVSSSAPSFSPSQAFITSNPPTPFSASTEPSAVPSRVPSLSPQELSSDPTGPFSNAPSSLSPTGEALSSQPSASPIIALPSAFPSDEPSFAPNSDNACSNRPREEVIVEEVLKITDENILVNTTSPQFLALNWLVSNDTLLDPCTYPTLDQRYALATFYFATDGQGWVDQEAWLSLNPECSWMFVNCTNRGLVESLAIVDNNLNGFLPDEIQVWNSIEIFDISHNFVSGDIPNIFNSWATSLRQFILERNSFSGTLPMSLASARALEDLILRDNQIEGSLSAIMVNLPSLITLDVSINRLEGQLPIVWTTTSLQHLGVEQNFLSGPIPDSLWTRGGLRSLKLGMNAFTGTLSSSVGNLQNLTDLVLENNQLAGPLPLLLGRLTGLERLSLAANQFTGTIRDFYANFNSLLQFDFSGNAFSGTIPSRLFDLVSIEMISIHSNSLEGRIPSNIGNAESLRSLLLYGNTLTGSIPGIGIEDWPQLTEFLVQDNRLSGVMAPSICELRQGGTDVFETLWADCADEASFPVECDSPSCCTVCFPLDDGETVEGFE